MLSLLRKVRGCEGGAAAVEFALVVPVLVLILFGIIEFGMVFRDSLTVTSATRSGARTASALPRSPSFHTATADAVSRSVEGLAEGAVEELWIYKAGADGFPEGRSDFSAGCGTCTIWDWNEAANTFVARSGPGWNPLTQDACAGTGDSVGIYLKINHDFVTGMFGADMALTDHTVMRLEPKPAFQGCR